MSVASLHRRGRTTERTVAGQSYLVRVDLTPPDAVHLARVVIERDEPALPDERWVWRVTDDRAAELLEETGREVPARIVQLLEDLGLVGVARA
jgi:hypothetical protein